MFSNYANTYWFTLEAGSREEKDRPKYCSIVRKTLFVVTKMLIEPANAVKELAKYLQASEAKSMECIFIFCWLSKALASRNKASHPATIRKAAHWTCRFQLCYRPK